MSRPTSLPSVLLLVVLATLLPTSLAWGDIGHSLIGRIAISQLTPAASTLLVTLAPDSSTVQGRPGGPNPNATVAGNISDPGIGSWPDRVRSMSSMFYYTDSWHFFNTKDWQCYYNAATDCPATGCVNTAIQNYTQRTADKALPLQEQQWALAFLVHFIEDLHQPLHGGFASDQDGNRIVGTFLTTSTGYTTNLHAMWDTNIIDTRIQRDFYSQPNRYYEYLLLALATQYNESMAGWRACSAQSAYTANYYACSDDWSQESARLACSTAYTAPDGTVLNTTTRLAPLSTQAAGERYYQSAIPVIELRLLQAGVRLANVLNSIAAGGAPATPTSSSTGSGHSNDTDSGSGVSKGAAGFMIFLIVVLILTLLVFCGLYYRKEKMGLPGLFARGSGGGGSMGLIGGDSSGGYSDSYSRGGGGGMRSSLL